MGQGRPYKSSLKYLVSAHLEREMQRDEVEGGRGEGAARRGGARTCPGAPPCVVGRRRHLELGILSTRQRRTTMAAHAAQHVTSPACASNLATMAAGGTLPSVCAGARLGGAANRSKWLALYALFSVCAGARLGGARISGAAGCPIANAACPALWRVARVPPSPNHVVAGGWPRL